MEMERAQAGALGQVLQGRQRLGLFDVTAGRSDQVRMALLDLGLIG